MLNRLMIKQVVFVVTCISLNFGEYSVPRLRKNYFPTYVVLGPCKIFLVQRRMNFCGY